MRIDIVNTLRNGLKLATQEKITRNQIETGAINSTNAPIAVAGLQSRCGRNREIWALG